MAQTPPVSIVTPITSIDDFKRIIDSDIPVFIDFWATWCVPCRAISPIFEEIAKRVGERGKFYKVDVETQPIIAMEVGVRVMPTFVAFKNGNKIGASAGAVPLRLAEMVKNVLDSPEPIIKPSGPQVLSEPAVPKPAVPTTSAGPTDAPKPEPTTATETPEAPKPAGESEAKAEAPTPAAPITDTASEAKVEAAPPTDAPKPVAES